jgi:hypothetical protein
MRRLFRWTIIFRGNFKRNLVNAYRRIKIFILVILRLWWTMIRGLLRVIFFVLGLNWYEIEAKIQRKMRIYFT